MRRVALLGIAIAVALAGCSIISIDLQPGVRPLQEDTVEGTGRAKILLVDLSGFLADDTPGFSLTTPPPRVPILARMQEMLRKAEKDDRVQALIVRINSAGGTITASDTLYREIDEFKRRKKIPVIAAIMDVGASGGYYVALAADTIVAQPTTVTGSIGVIMLTVNAHGLMEKIGVAPLAIKTGPMKDAGSPFRALTPEERAVFQGVIDDMFSRFVMRIVQSRKMSEERVRALADGRIYTADQALTLGLVDRVAYLDEVVAMARQAIVSATVIHTEMPCSRATVSSSPITRSAKPRRERPIAQPAAKVATASASSTGSMSPIGEAVPRLPPSVPSPRICREPSRASSAASGAKPASARSR